MQALIQFYKNLTVENRRWLRASFILFIITAILGATAFFSWPGLLEVIIEGLAERFGSDPALDMNLALQIFLQNLMVAAIAIFGGLLFGLLPILVVGVNGFIFGFVLTSVFFIADQNPASSLALILGGIAPHGILELPAFLVAAAIGLRLGLEWLRKEAKGSRWNILKNNFKNAFIVFPALAFVLILAALIEVFVSGKIVDNF